MLIGQRFGASLVGKVKCLGKESVLVVMPASGLCRLAIHFCATRAGVE